MLQVKVPATSANLCVGFDVLGLALSLYNTFTFEKSNEFEFFGFDDEFNNINNNLVYDSYKYTFDKLGRELIPVRIGFKGDIPVSRGLGSSSSLIVAGVFAANYFLGNPLTKNQLFDITVSIEGHPDNVAPAIYGSLVASYKYENNFYPNIYKVSKDLDFITVTPPFHLSTHEARKVLPQELPYSDIVNNTSRIVNIPRALERGDVSMLKRLFIDTMHEPYRSKLIPTYDDIKAICDKLNVCFAISGSGSTMLIILKKNKKKLDTLLKKLKPFNYDVKKLHIASGVKMEEM